jgi:alpha-glucosidase
MGHPAGTSPATVAWWPRAVVYQVYLRSFADADGDGVGDIPGLRARLPWIRALGADAVWVNPWYPSPMVDGGYDVADYRAIDPRFGTLDDVRGLLHDAHALGLRVLADIVPNHTSADHPWFREALAAEPGSTARARYLFRDGRGPGGDEPPNNWLSVFGGGAWTRAPRTGDRQAQWYCHLFDPLQPDLDWSNPEVREEFEAILRFWFDLGIDGFRIDVAQGMVKADGLPDVPHGVGPWVGGMSHPYWGQDGVHDILRAWRRIADAYPDPRVLIGEVGPTEDDKHARMARFVRPGELHGVFNFDLMAAAWDAQALREAIDGPLAAHADLAAPVAWVLGNHDTPRQVTRYGRAVTSAPTREEQARSHASDLDLGTRRARAAALLLLALPGPAFLYAGEELGLPDVDDLPDEVIDDPVWRRSGFTIRGRDGCRVPLPWAGNEPPFGFSRTGGRTWLPQPAAWALLTAEAEEHDPASTLTLYREALALRRAYPGLAGGDFRWMKAPEGVLAFGRGAGFVCMVNTSDDAVPLPAACAVLLRSDAGAAPGAPLPADAAVWLGPPARLGTQSRAERRYGSVPEREGRFTHSRVPPPPGSRDRPIGVAGWDRRPVEFGSG